MEETFEFEGTQYVSPTTSRDEQLGFIDNLRAVQSQNNEQIKEDTHNLGTQTTSNLGGLTGAEGKWKAEYQTPQINYTVDNLKSVAQQSALNTALSNLQNAWQNRYNQAQRAYAARQNSGPLNNPSTSGIQIDTETPMSGDLVAEQAPVSVPNDTKAQSALESIIYNYSTNNKNKNTAQGIKYYDNGQAKYAVLYRDNAGRLLGGDVYNSNNGTLTPQGNYTSSGIANLLNGRNNIYDLYGENISNTWSIQ